MKPSTSSRRRCERFANDTGANANGVFGSGALTNEKAYLLGKFARVALRTANIDYNGRFCMSLPRQHRIVHLELIAASLPGRRHCRARK